MKTNVILVIGLIAVSILLMGLLIINLNEHKVTEKYSYSPEGILELQRANYIANSGYEWTGKDELIYAIKLNKLKRNGGLN